MNSKRIRLLLILFFLIFSSILSAMNLSAYIMPSGIHLSWENDPRNSMTVTWLTPFDLLYQPMVEYGKHPGDLTHKASGSSKTVIGSNQLEMIHVVELTGLTENTTYYYHCGNQRKEEWSNQYQFKTADIVDSHFRFVSLGDSRTNISARIQVIDAVSHTDPAFIMHTGDLVASGAVFDQWKIFFDNIQKVCSETPFLPCIGNHDVLLFGKCVPFYYKLFALPDDEHWYSFDYKNIHVIMLNSEERFTNIKKDTTQYQWLQSDLKEASTNTEIEWIFACFHRPPYNSGSHHGNDTLIRDHWCPLFDTYRVDIVFNGHEHTYERSFPIYDDAIVQIDSAYCIEQVNGTIYIITGGAGAPLYDTPGGDWVAANADQYHFCLIDVYDNHSIRVQTRSTNQEILDEFWLKKGKNPTANFSFEPTNEIFTYETIQFTDRSIDPDGKIFCWNWTLDNKTIRTQQHPVYFFNDDGMYQIYLTVTDNTGFTDNMQQNLTITNRKPTPLFQCNKTQNITREENLFFTDLSTDMDGQIISTEWFCDNQSIGKTKTLSYSFDKPGIYNLSLHVIDDDGAEALCYHIIHVKDSTYDAFLIFIGFILVFLFIFILVWWQQQSKKRS